MPKKKFIELCIAGDGSTNWAVISMLGGSRFDGKYPCIVSSDLSTKEAAEIALRRAELRVADDGIPYGSSSTSRYYIEKAGLVLAELRKSEVSASDDVELAIRITDTACCPVDDEIPF